MSKAAVVTAAVATVLAGALTGGTGAHAATGTANPYAPSYQHPYRHGAVPTRTAQDRMNNFSGGGGSPGNLPYQGGVDGIGVTTGPPKVYLVFWGSGWGTSSTNGAGDLTFSNDSAGGASHLQEMFKGLGTNNELWSAVMTQYCEQVPVGTTDCTNFGGPHVAYPLGGALAGVWYDPSPVGTNPNAHQIAVEAVDAAGHFGNTTAAANRSAQYVIFSPKGSHPDGFPGAGFCAWHDWNGDTTLPGGGAAGSAYGDIAFTNLPYVLDAGKDCGQNYVNSGSPGNVDGFSIVEGHEYAETITDQNPRGGWIDSDGAENADRCAWKGTGGTGGAANVALSTGSFAEQGTWSNALNNNQGGCAISRSLVTVTNPGNQVTQVNLISATVPFFAYGGFPSYTLSASGLPPGLSIDPSSGEVAGIPTQIGDFFVTVTATDAQGFVGSTSLTWSVIPRQGTVPNVVNSKLTAARSTIVAKGFTVGRISFVTDFVNCTKDIVADQSPAGGSVRTLGSPVDLTVTVKPAPPFQCP
jgi:hypothetical protein